MTSGGSADVTSGSPATAAEARVPPAFRAIDDLGAMRVVAAVPRSRRAGFSLGLLLAWAVSIFIAGFLVAMFAQIFLELDDLATLAIAAVLWIAGFAVVLRWLRRKGAQVVVLYEQGVAVGDGRQVRRWRWEDFASIERRPIVHELKPEVPTDVAGVATAVAVIGVLAALRVANRRYVRVYSYYWFFDRSGGAFSLDRWLPSVDDLAEALDLEITARMLPPAQARLAEGQAVGFGAITLTPDGLAVPGLEVPLATLDRLEVDNDAVHVTVGGTRRATVAMARIANLTLLLQLLDEASAKRA